MSLPMEKTVLSRAIAGAIVVVVLLASLSPALAVDVSVPNPGVNTMVPTVGEIQNLQNRLQRQQFQQQQQFQREQDRQVKSIQPPIEIQRIQPNCTQRTYAAGTIQSCQ